MAIIESGELAAKKIGRRTGSSAARSTSTREVEFGVELSQLW